MSPHKLRFGIIGAGGIAQAYARAFEQCESAEIIGVADVRREAASAMAEMLGCQAYTSYQSLADEAGLDAAIVCTPPVTHPEISISFLERGIHVLCEKPFSIDSAGARRMLDVARRSGVRLTMASKFRYVDDVVRARSIVASGILGDILLLENSFASAVDMSNRWNSRPEISGGGVLIDNGTHSLDLARYFLGPLAEVQVIEGRRVQNLPVEETVRVFVRSGSGALGSIHLSWSLQQDNESYISIHGTHGTVHVGWKGSRYRQASSRDWISFGRGYDKVQAFRSQIENFARAIRGQEALLITPQDSIASVEAVEAAYEALRQSHWTPIRRDSLNEIRIDSRQEPLVMPVRPVHAIAG